MASLEWRPTVARIEDLLREEFRYADQPVPERDAMLARVAKARQRRMVVAAAGLSVVLAGAAVAAISTFQPSLVGRDVGDGLPPRVYSAELINTVFTDHMHGYVVQQRCAMDVPGDVPDDAPTPDVHRDCGSQLLVTTDAGRTWRVRTLPGEPATKDAGVTLVPGHSLMLWIDASGRLAFGGWDRRYWTTADGGSTWQESSAPRDIGPSGSWGTFAADGKLTFLAMPPPGAVGEKNPIIPATDGSFWVACTAGPCVYVTHDHGASWQTLPTVDSATHVQWVATSGGHTVFAAVRTASGSRLVRSTDGGTTWSDVLGLAQPEVGGLALPNGDLILAQADKNGGMYRLKAGASVPEKLTRAPAHTSTMYLTGGIVVAGQAWGQQENPDLDSVVSVSADGGTTWTAVPAPPA
jgi:hypothetical protein